MVSTQRRDLRNCRKASCIGAVAWSLNSIFKHKDFFLKILFGEKEKFQGNSNNNNNKTTKTQKQLCAKKPGDGKSEAVHIVLAGV